VVNRLQALSLVRNARCGVCGGRGVLTFPSVAFLWKRGKRFSAVPLSGKSALSSRSLHSGRTSCAAPRTTAREKEIPSKFEDFSLSLSGNGIRLPLPVLAKRERRESVLQRDRRCIIDRVREPLKPIGPREDLRTVIVTLVLIPRYSDPVRCLAVPLLFLPSMPWSAESRYPDSCATTQPRRANCEREEKKGETRWWKTGRSDTKLREMPGKSDLLNGLDL